MDRLAEARGVSRSKLLRGLVIDESGRAGDRSVTDVADEHELLVLLTERARAGNVAAMKELRAALRASEEVADGDEDPGDPFASLDELEDRRKARSHGA